ncbi:hypothetical protein BX616_011242 [Lobosporangium transversale]|uniref:CsbD-like domain-containing protein n=1 Tax=Lobosporangium transversale TaxID=64571 RepID=A0A1Y2GQ63_9FUNG|nr:hypothetical protein BCR41DRAFT_304451 [Lobosporangium transversale]KAF9909284.1 hypothetical protein BX616_011242 [Lobosporangium transversale]ORZ18388.1 hypothetical protein BCR41DRAFT_304451 [Lobosporangium transversale]|eukprot:XP_021882183.1 hypothetical protein BCR41DRAFT_304451 [Lobosporangium transversale]
MTERISNTVNATLGGWKQKIGENLGQPELAASGAAQKTQAENAQRQADEKKYVDGIGHTVEGQAQQKIGSLTGDKTMQAEGIANEALGAAEKQNLERRYQHH